MLSVRSSNTVVVVVRDKLRNGRYTAVLLINGRPFSALAQYFRERNSSLSNERTIARAVALLVDFIVARESEFSEVSQRRELFNSFAHTLAFGSINDGEDSTRLWWKARSLENTEKLLVAVCEFSDWLVINYGTNPLNPYRNASYAERIVFWRRWNKFKYSSLLAHIKDRPEGGAIARTFAPPARRLAIAGRPPYFPHEHFDELLMNGFRTASDPHLPMWRQYNIRDMMIAILLHAGGVRVSEPFHMWVSDVYADAVDADLAHVRIYHPEDGEITYPDPITGTLVTTNRKAYLQIQYGRRPLNHETPYNGWKGNLLQSHGKFMPVFWYPQHYGRLFLTLFKIYITHIRPISLPHPWLFVSEQGNALTAKSYRKQHAAAVRRIGLVPSKPRGTTPHGHRHAFGQLMQGAIEVGHLDRKSFQMVMHHRSVLSQEAYNEKDWARINDTLKALEQRNGSSDHTAMDLFK